MIIRRHEADGSLSGDYGSASWAVDAGAYGGPGFRFLRIRDTSGRQAALHIGGLEVYGAVRAAL